MNPGTKPAPREIYALLFGLFLGLCIIKFGNPVILDHKIFTPQTLPDLWNDAWPTHWTQYLLVPLAIISTIFLFTQPFPPIPRLLCLLPLIWFAWQLISATTTVDNDLTTATLWQYAGCIACYFTGAFLFHQKKALNWLLIGILAASTYCLVRAVEQKAYEFPLNYQVLLEGEHTGWTIFPPPTLLEMKQESVIINTNGLDIANPVILTKFAKGRVCGTLVYPNALAGLILLLFPVALTLALQNSRRLRPPIRWLTFGMLGSLGLLSFVWTGSKLGWLLAIIVIGVYLLHLPWSARLKIIALTAVLILGLGIFGIRFHTYFAKGATSVTARFDYWRAAVKTTETKPLTGSGPGTFQRPYQFLKSPDSEMARLAHNDYLEQFSDSGLPGGLTYALWIGLALWAVGRHVWKIKDMLFFGVFAGLLAWFLQGFGEFSLFIPGLAWVTFTLLGALIGQLQINSTEKTQ